MNQLQLKEPLSKAIIDHLNLDTIQIDELINKPQIKMEGQAIIDVANFFKGASKLMFCGDFDADGVTSTSIAALIAQALNIEYGFYIPDRIKEGYGTSVATIQAAYDKGYTHIVMIDNGVKAFEAIAKAKELGLKLAIVDHHHITEEIHVDAYLHPDFLSPYGHSMSAAGLMVLIAEYLEIDNPMIQVLGCIGTIADVMPLWHKNRELVIKGIELLNSNKFKQIDVLVKRSAYIQYTAQFLAFNLIPKINSVGRLSDHGNMNTMVKYFLSNDDSLINTYAQQVMKLNDLRKDMSKRMSAQALLQVNPLSSVNIILDEDFHEGILGIIANQIMHQTGKPTMILKDLKTHYKGSSRSSTISLSDMFLNLNEDYFLGLGGHDFAYGLTVKADYFSEFEAAVNDYMSSQPQLRKKELSLNVDASLITQAALQELQRFEPYGEGFKMPKLRVKMPSSYTISPINGYGYKYNFNQGTLDEAVLFSLEHDLESLKQVTYIIGTPSYTSFRKVSILIDELEF